MARDAAVSGDSSSADDRQEGSPGGAQSADPYDLVGPAEIRVLLGVSRQRTYQLTRSEHFPDPSWSSTAEQSGDRARSETG